MYIILRGGTNVIRVVSHEEGRFCTQTNKLLS